MFSLKVEEVKPNLVRSVTRGGDGLLRGASGVNGYIQNLGSYVKLACYWGRDGLKMEVISRISCAQ
jgi:hypothetical protein